MSAAATLRFGALDDARARIAAVPAQVYAVVLDRARWAEGFVAKTIVDGAAGAVGERARYLGANGERIEEVLAAEPPRRLVSRLADAADTETHAFAEWRIEAEDDGCVLTFTLFWTDVAPAGSSWPEVQALRADYSAKTQRQLQAHVARIKAAAEGGEEG